MEQKRKYPIRQVSITNMTKFLNFLAGKTYRSNEIVELSKEYHIRANFLSYAKQMNYCKKDESGAYFFLDRLFDPIHAKHLIEVSNKYNNEVLAKKKRLLEEKENLTKNVELDKPFNTEETHFHQRNLLELQVSALKNENDILENEISGLLDSKSNLKKSVINLEKEVNDLHSENEKFKIQVTELKSKNNMLVSNITDLLDANDNLKKSVINLEKEVNDLYSENEKFKKSVDKSLQKENDLLKEKISSLEKLVSIYFK